MDLLRLFPYTPSGKAASRIDLGRPGAEAYRVRGWSAPEVLPTGESVVRAIQRFAVLQFTAPAREAMRMHVRCALTSAPSERPQKIMVRLNDRWLDPIFPQRRLDEYEVLLPKTVLRAGKNTLQFSHRGLPRRAATDEHTHATVAYESIRFERVDGGPRGAYIARNSPTEALVTPAPSQVDFFLRVPAAAKLTFQMEMEEAERSADVAVSVQRDGAQARTPWSHAVAASPSQASVDLSGYAGAVVRLSLKVEGTGTVRLTRPQVVGFRRAPSPRAPATGRQKRRPNVVLYLIDTLRADHLGCYGYGLPTSPSIDRFAASATVFTHTVAQASWTRPSTGSILTGRYPYAHGAVGVHDRLRGDIPTLAEVLQRQGYETIGFVTNINVSASFGFNRGFERYTYLPEDEARPSVHVLSDQINKAVFDWLDARSPRPFFLYVHATDPHAPYTPPAELAARFRDPALATTLLGVSNPLRRMLDDQTVITPENIAYVESFYDGEIAFVDRSFGALLEELRHRGLYDNTIVVLTADHGEEFHQHGGFQHGHTLYQEMLHVPLLFHWPEAHGGEDAATLARQIDIMPTLLDYLDTSPPADLDGRSLLDPRAPPPDATFSQTSLDPLTEMRSVVEGDWKTIEKNIGHLTTLEIYNHAIDPLEQRPVGGMVPILLEYEAESMERWKGQALTQMGTLAETEKVLDPGVTERLRMLGYTQ